MSGSVIQRKAFHDQRHAAGKRGIDWLLTIDEWLEIWRASGKLEQRGRGFGKYCMARVGDVGPYRDDNVYITTGARNIKDYYLVHGDEHRKIIRRNNLTLSLKAARGWTLIKGKAKPYQVYFRKTYIGSFATQEEAERVHRGIVLGELARA